MRNEATLSKEYAFNILIFLYSYILILLYSYILIFLYSHNLIFLYSYIFYNIYLYYISYHLHSNCIWYIVTHLIIVLLFDNQFFTCDFQNINMSSYFSCSMVIYAPTFGPIPENLKKEMTEQQIQEQERRIPVVGVSKFGSEEDVRKFIRRTR